MVCPKCGTFIEDTYKECPICGWDLIVEESDEYTDTDSVVVDSEDKEEIIENTNKRNYSIGKFIGIITAIAAVIICVVIAIPNLMHLGYRSVVSDYFKSIKNSDYALIMSLYPSETTTIAGIKKDQYVKTKVDMESQNLKSTYGDDFKLSYKILSSKKVEVNSDIKNISEAVELNIQVSISGNNKKDKSEIKLTLIKLEGKWYINAM